MAGFNFEEKDGDTGPGAAEDSRKTPNARRRALQEFLHGRPSVTLTHCKRCGPEVTSFVSTLMPFAEDFCSDEEIAAPTRLWHVFYDGKRWEPSAAAQVDPPRTRGGQAQSSKGAERDRHGSPVGWHTVLFKCLLAMCMKQMEHLNQTGKLHTTASPYIMIACPLERVAVPLAYIVTKLWPRGEVSVRLIHGARGHDALIVHAIRHRRWTGGSPDQYKGLQGDLAREYVMLTRGKVATVMWLEHAPLGLPQASVKSAKPDQLVPATLARYATARLEVVYKLNMSWFGLTCREDRWPWHEVFNWNFGSAEGLSQTGA